MASRGPRHFTKDSPHARDGFLVKEGALRPLPSDSSPMPGLAHQPRLDHEVSPGHVGPPSTPPPGMEQKMVAQHAEIQRLIGENQRLAVTHVALRQELAAAQEEIMRLQQQSQSRSANDTEKEQRLNITQVALRQELADSKQEVNKLQEDLAAVCAEKDQHLRAAIDKSVHLEAELKAIESLKADFDKVLFQRDELAARMEYLSADLKKVPVKDQEIFLLKREVDELRERFQQARMDFELQKKLNIEHVERQQAMEKGAFAMTREIERLRADLVNADRRHQAYLSASSGGQTATLSLQKSGTTLGVYGNTYNTTQEPSKGSSTENKSVVDISKYGAEAETMESRLSKQTSVAGADMAGDWSKHDAPNGRSFYYNLVTGASQWDKPATTTTGGDENTIHQRQTQQDQGTAATDVTPDLPASQSQQQKFAGQQAQSVQQSVSPVTVQSAAASQTGSPGVNLLVLGLSEGISDRDLASLFHPYGAILHAKIMVDTKSGPPQIYGVVTMESAQAAESAAVAVTGMFILGRRIKVEIQSREQASLHQGHAQHLLQGMMQGGIGPIRPHHRHGGPSGHWPY